MPLTSGWLTSASLASLLPCTILTTPSGKPTSEIISKHLCMGSGVVSLGLTTSVHPTASAIGMNQNGAIDGKLNGPIIPNAPKGSLIDEPSIPVAIWSRCSPFVSV